MRVPGMLETLRKGAQHKSAPRAWRSARRTQEAVARVRTVFERPVAPASPSRHAGPGERSRATSWFRRTSRHYSATSLAWGPSAPCTRLSRSPWGHRHPSSAPAAAAAGALLLSRRSSEPLSGSERPAWLASLAGLHPGRKKQGTCSEVSKTYRADTPPRRARHKPPSAEARRVAQPARRARFSSPGHGTTRRSRR